MKLLDRITEARTIGGVPWEPWRNPYWKFNIGGPVHPSRQVTGVDSVVSLAALYAAVRLIADGVASLPLNTYRRTPDGVAHRMTNLTPLLETPSIIDTPYDWLFKCMTSLLLEGNAWGLITTRSGIASPTGLGYPTTVEWLPPQDMSVEDDQHEPYNPMRTRIYYLGRLMDREQLIHVKAFSIAGRTEAISPMRAFMHLIGQGKEALDYSYQWFRNGGFPPSTFQNLAEEVDETQAKEIRRRLTDTIRSREPLVYGRDWDWKPVNVPQNEAAFIQAMQLNAAQIGAIYGVPPERIGGLRGNSLTYSTQEQESLSLIVDTLRPWLVRLEHAFDPLLPSTQFCRFHTDALLKTDLKTRHEIYSIDRNMGFRTVDEMRHEEDREPMRDQLGTSPLALELEIAMSRTTKALTKQVAKAVQVMEPVAWHGTVTGKLPPGGEQINPPDTPEHILPGPVPAGGGGGGFGDDSSDNSGGGGGGSDGDGDGGGRSHPLSRPAFETRAAEWRQFGPANLKASDAERQAACRLLHQHLLDGRLTEAEFGEREPRALLARTRGQLDGLFEDLPVMALPVENREPGPATEPTAALTLLELRQLSSDDEVARRQLAATNGHGRGH